MKVFISYAFSDTEIMKLLQEELQSYGIETYVATHDPRPGEHLDNKIESAIDGSDALVAIITRSATSASVNQEIAFAEARKIGIFPLVEPGAVTGVLLQGLEYIELNTREITTICKKIVKCLLQTPREKVEPPKEVSAVLVDETVIVPGHSLMDKHLLLKKRDNLEIRISSDSQIHVFIYDQKNLMRFKKGGKSYFSKGGKNVVRWNGFFNCPGAGLWTLILDNRGRIKGAKVDIKITKSKGKPE